MGLKEIVGIRQYTDFTPDGKVMKMYEVKFTTEKSEGEFTFDIPAHLYTAEKAIDMAKARAEDLDKAIG